MSVCAWLLCLSLTGGGGMDDPWISEDKWKHFFASFAATTLAAGGARLAGADRATAVWIGAGVGVGAGVAKEVWDMHDPAGNPSWRDLAWDLLGVGAGAAVAARTR